MTLPTQLDPALEQRIATRLMDVLIRAGLLLAMTLLCYRVFAPFLPLTIWALILAVTLYPLHQSLTKRIGGREGLAATLMVLVGIALIVTPTALLMSSLGDSLQQLISSIQNNTLKIPPPRPELAHWPIIGEKAYAVWQEAYSNLPALVHSLQPKIGELAKSLLSFVASIGGGVLQFLGALIIAGIIMTFGQSGGRGSQAISARIAGAARGGELLRLSTATIRAVAQGVIGVAFIQAILVGLALMVAGVPWAGALAGVMLVLGIAQVPALIITVPAIIYIWSSGDYSHAAAIVYTVLLLLSGMADNVLKPLMLGRGVDAPMPVILLGALGGMATGGIVGMFVGATLLALGYQLFMGWVSANPEATRVAAAGDPPAAD